MKTLGQRIRKRRNELGWSQENLARESGLKLSTVQNIERDLVSNPTFTTICKLARALQVSFLYLLPDNTMKFMQENPVDQALIELSQLADSKEKMDSIKTMIAASSAFYSPK